MTSAEPLPDELWEWACEDAGEVGDVVLVDVSGFETPNSRGRFMPPGEREVALAPDDLARVNAHVGHARVVLPVSRLASDPPALLALMRHHLEYARVLSVNRAGYELSLVVAAALYPVYQHAGPGSAVVYNAIPMMRSANAIAGRLVARALGPQFSRLHDPMFGAMFRTDREPVTVDRLPRHATAFAAIWPDAVDNELDAEMRERDRLLASAHTQAPAWWSALLSDETFRALALGAATFRPTPAERDAFRDHPAAAWRTGEALIDRAVDFGLALIERRDQPGELAGDAG
jgi:hypothetical protein